MAALCQSPLALKYSSRLVPAAAVELLLPAGRDPPQRSGAPKKGDRTPGEPDARPPPRPGYPRRTAGRHTDRGSRQTRKNEQPGDDRRQATRRPRTRGTSDNARTDDTTTNEPEAATDTTHLREKGNDRTDQTAAGRQSSPPRCQGVPQYESTLAPACPGFGSETRPTYRAGGPLQGSETRPTLNTNPAAVSSGAGGPGQAGAG
jgi:hypothetical protein